MSNMRFRKSSASNANPHDGRQRFRLRGVDLKGAKWSLGWTTLQQVDPGNDTWTFVGEIDGLIPQDAGDTVTSDSCTELVYLVPINHTTALRMGRFVLSEQPGGRPRREYVLETLGSTVRFAYEPSLGALSITAMHSAELLPTFTENWLGEPLRILFGQLIFPRLVARNLGNGRTHIHVRRCPGLIGGATRLAALWRSDDFGQGKEDFWCRYTELLNVIARARNFEAHKITHLYEEVIQAARGTRWTWAMTFASCIEALANMLEPPGRDRPDADADAVAGLVKYIIAWPGDGHLKQSAVNAVQRTLKTTTVIGLRRLVLVGAITATQLKAWEEIRHSVMHGSLISSYSSEEENNKLFALADMMHALTLEILQRYSLRSPTHASSNNGASEPNPD